MACQSARVWAPIMTPTPFGRSSSLKALNPGRVSEREAFKRAYTHCRGLCGSTGTPRSESGGYTMAFSLEFLLDFATKEV